MGVTDNPLGSTLNNGVDTAVTFTEEAFDTDGMFTFAQPTRITCQEDGFYYVTANVFWGANVNGYRRLRIRSNGGPIILVGVTQDAVGTAGVGTDQTLTKGVWQAHVGDYVEVMALQTSGGALACNIAFTAFKVSETQ